MFAAAAAPLTAVKFVLQSLYTAVTVIRMQLSRHSSSMFAHPGSPAALRPGCVPLLPLSDGALPLLPLSDGSATAATHHPHLRCVPSVLCLCSAAERAAAHRTKRSQTTLLSGVEPGTEEVHLLYQLAEAQLQRQIQREQQEEGAALLKLQQQQQQVLEPVPIGGTTQSHLAVMHAQVGSPGCVSSLFWICANLARHTCVWSRRILHRRTSTAACTLNTSL